MEENKKVEKECECKNTEKHLEYSNLINILSSINWRNMSGSNNKFYLKSKFTEDSYAIIITDMERIYSTENKDEQDILKQFKRYNKRSQIKVSSLMETLQKHINNQQEAVESKIEKGELFFFNHFPK